MNCDNTHEKINLIGNYKLLKKKNREYKGEYARFFPTKISSTNFLTLYSLFILDTKGEPVYGKEILNDIGAMLDSNVWKPSHGTLYPLLTEMENRGLIKTDLITKSKKFYTITDEGKKYLEEQLVIFKSILVSSGNFFNNVVSKMYDD